MTRGAAGERRFRAVALATALSALSACADRTSPGAVRSVAAEGTEFVVSLAGGLVLRSADLVGAKLHVDDGGTPRAIRVDAVEREAATGVWLHALSLEVAPGAFEPFCEPDPDGRRLAFPLAGHSLRDGRLAADPARFELVCTSGAQGKCVRFGYAPWRRLDTYNACVRMLRADYCGTGEPTTRDGTRVEIWDAASAPAPEPVVGLRGRLDARGRRVRGAPAHRAERQTR